MMKSINAGTYAGGGIIQPEYLAIGGMGSVYRPTKRRGPLKPVEEKIEHVPTGRATHPDFDRTTHPSYAPVQITPGIPSAPAALTEADKQILEAATQAAEKKALLDGYISLVYGDDRDSAKAREYIKTNSGNINKHFGKISDFRSQVRLERSKTLKEDREIKRQAKISEIRSDPKRGVDAGGTRKKKHRPLFPRDTRKRKR